MGGALSTQAEDSSHDPFPTQQDAVAPPAPADQDLHIIDDTSLLTTVRRPLGVIGHRRVSLCDNTLC